MLVFTHLNLPYQLFYFKYLFLDQQNKKNKNITWDTFLIQPLKKQVYNQYKYYCIKLYYSLLQGSLKIIYFYSQITKLPYFIFIYLFFIILHLYSKERSI